MYYCAHYRLKIWMNTNPIAKRMLKAYTDLKTKLSRGSRKYKIAAEAAKLEEGTTAEQQPLVDPYDMTKVPFSTAIKDGYLTNEEYSLLAMWVGVLVLIFIMGMVIFGANRPHWMGMVIWTMSYVFLFTVIPIIKWFNTYEVDRYICHYRIRRF